VTRPAWVPRHLPALDGLRGLAISLVLLYHCHTLLGHGLMARFAEFGWVGVNLFFVLSGFLISGIILDSRDDPRFFRNFYARRALRIWPVYVLLLLGNYVLLPSLLELNPHRAWQLTATAPWLYYVLFVQNLFFLPLPAPISPTWSLAIEEQFYLFWAPVGRLLKPKHLAAFLVAAFVASPILRACNTGFLTPTHTLVHLDGLAIGSLIAVLLRMDVLARRHWQRMSVIGMALGAAGVVLMLIRGTAFADTLLALGFAGMLLAAILPETRPSLYRRTLSSAPVKFLGTISYGLYMMHILVFVVIGTFEHWVRPYGTTVSNLAIVTARLLLSVGAATLLWNGFEKPILRLKSRFESPTQLAPAGEAATGKLLAKTASAD